MNAGRSGLHARLLHSGLAGEQPPKDVRTKGRGNETSRRENGKGRRWWWGTPAHAHSVVLGPAEQIFAD